MVRIKCKFSRSRYKVYGRSGGMDLISPSGLCEKRRVPEPAAKATVAAVRYMVENRPLRQ
eukprot:3273991-Rhodomonas_salina.2